MLPVCTGTRSTTVLWSWSRSYSDKQMMLENGWKLPIWFMLPSTHSKSTMVSAIGWQLTTDTVAPSWSKPVQWNGLQRNPSIMNTSVE